jgi:hypothetical protein
MQEAKDCSSGIKIINEKIKMWTGNNARYSKMSIILAKLD